MEPSPSPILNTLANTPPPQYPLWLPESHPLLKRLSTLDPDITTLESLHSWPQQTTPVVARLIATCPTHPAPLARVIEVALTQYASTASREITASLFDLRKDLFQLLESDFFEALSETHCPLLGPSYDLALMQSFYPNTPYAGHLYSYNMSEQRPATDYDHLLTLIGKQLKPDFRDIAFRLAKSPTTHSPSASIHSRVP